jgi:hypothetical protein
MRFVRDEKNRVASKTAHGSYDAHRRGQANLRFGRDGGFGRDEKATGPLEGLNNKTKR